MALEEDITQKSPSAKKIWWVDTGANITYSLITGIPLDYSAGLNFLGIVGSRASGTAMNFATGGPYGWWREKAYELTRTNEEPRSLINSLKEAYTGYPQEGINVLKEPAGILIGKTRKALVDLLAFNSFQVPIYATSVAIGSLISEGTVDLEKVQEGATYLATFSPLIGPTLGLWTDGFRRLFGIRSAAEGAYKERQTQDKD
jgi:hypothetical protein